MLNNTISNLKGFYFVQLKTFVDIKKLVKYNKPRRIAKTKHMTYPCIPIWMKSNKRDQFDYPLRTKKEIAFEQYMNPPLFNVDILKYNYNVHTQNPNLNVHKADNRNNEVKIVLKFDEMKLTPLQKKRLIFLLGPRYKTGDTQMKIVCRQYLNFEHNLMRAMDILRQLYWEAKRAPMYYWPKMKGLQRRKLAKKIFGKHLSAEERKIAKENAEKEVMMVKQKFDEMYDSGNYTAQAKENRIQEFIDKYYKKTNINDGPDQSVSIKKEDLPTVKVEDLAREKIEKRLVEKKILTKKAYDTFYSNQ